MDLNKIDYLVILRKAELRFKRAFFLKKKKYSVFPISISLQLLEKEGELLCFLKKKKNAFCPKNQSWKKKIKLKEMSWDLKKSADAAIVKHVVIVDLSVYLFCVPLKVQVPDTWSSPSHPPYQASHLLPLSPLDINDAHSLVVSRV